MRMKPKKYPTKIESTGEYYFDGKTYPEFPRKELDEYNRQYEADLKREEEFKGFPRAVK